MAHEYVQVEELKATLELSNTEFVDQDIPIALEAASRAIDKYCGRRFYADTADTDRFYTADRPDLLWIDDLTELADLFTDTGDNTYDQTWATTDYVLEPRNATIEGKPYTTIRRLNGGNFYFPNLFANSVKVTGKFGWAVTPPEVKEATTILATQFLKRAREAPFGVVSFNVEIGTTARVQGVDRQLKLLLDPYRRWRPFA